MIKLADTKEKYSTDSYALNQFEELFGDTSSLVEEFNSFWDTLLPQAIKIHNRPPYNMGEWAGSGCIDYNEGKALYIFTRLLQPNIIIELGYAGGISTSCISRALEVNGSGKVYAVDLSPHYWDVCDMFVQFREKNIIVQHHTTDAVEFVNSTDLEPGLTFTDATHEYGPTYKIASTLRKRWPNIMHLYHEWGMSNRSGGVEQSYVSIKNQIGTQWERDAFEDSFGIDFSHGGIVGSCGLGIVAPLN